MRGIILAGGRGTRLYPSTGVVSKQLLPIYDTPMVFHPLALLMAAGLREILIISSPDALPSFQRLLGDGARFGMRLEYAEQDQPRGIAEALIIAEPFLRGGASTLALGDNLFVGGHTARLLRRAIAQRSGATIFTTAVENPSAFGNVVFDQLGRPDSIEEKPVRPRSNQAIVGLYVFDHRGSEIAHAIKPSARGEIEITDVLRDYLKRGQLVAEPLPTEERWFDTGTPNSLLAASLLVCDLEAATGHKLACLEAIAFESGWITKDHLRAAGIRWSGSNYGHHLQTRANQPEKAAAGLDACYALDDAPNVVPFDAHGRPITKRVAMSVPDAAALQKKDVQ